MEGERNEVKVRENRRGGGDTFCQLSFASQSENSLDQLLGFHAYTLYAKHTRCSILRDNCSRVLSTPYEKDETPRPQ